MENTSARRVALGAIVVALAMLPPAAGAQAPKANAPAAPAKSAPEPKYDAQAFQQAVADITKAFDAGDHAKLDRLHDEYLELLRKGGHGRNMLDAFAVVFETYFRADKREALEKTFAAWRKEAPQSKLRPAAEGAMYRSLAWQARGGGAFKDVPEDKRKAFREHLEHATNVIEQGQAAGREGPLWYWTAIATGGAIGAPPAALDRFFNDGAAKFPLFMPLYYARLSFLLPQWGGDYARVDGFIRSAVARTQATEGTTLYAILYADVSRSYGGTDFFGGTRASWPLMKHAFEDELALQATDPGTAADLAGNLNRYAAFACLARDRDTTRSLIADLGEKLDLGPPGGPVSTEACKELAAGK